MTVCIIPPTHAHKHEHEHEQGPLGHRQIIPSGVRSFHDSCNSSRTLSLGTMSSLNCGVVPGGGGLLIDSGVLARAKRQGAARYL